MPFLLNFRFPYYAVKLYVLVFSRLRQCFIVPLVLEVPVVYAGMVSVEGLALSAYNKHALIGKCLKMHDVTKHYRPESRVKMEDNQDLSACQKKRGRGNASPSPKLHQFVTLFRGMTSDHHRC